MKYHLLICSIIISIIGLSCKTNEPLSKEDKLHKNSWTLSQIHFDSTQLSNMKRKIPNIRFESDGDIAGTTGCNSISGKYFVKDNYIIIRLEALRKKGCSKIENDLIVSLNKASSF
ncbi:META domain-containing protein [Mangrovivirga cuniculi]|uniref:DUF306 domain-containing protein n=1 Tax=Mangrovivirga cuniculi TaxID=2715131 RepID=A0A4D7JPJ1_9BACT|nr:META domain-containing protein [Mangrovivirga cuniculi]QCK15410.1 hypothetical protein DCC35_11970 [Mangrovivirga cuniculi]